MKKSPVFRSFLAVFLTLIALPAFANEKITRHIFGLGADSPNTAGYTLKLEFTLDNDVLGIVGHHQRKAPLYYSFPEEWNTRFDGEDFMKIVIGTDREITLGHQNIDGKIFMCQGQYQNTCEISIFRGQIRFDINPRTN